MNATSALRSVTVLATGPSALVQDLGRPGYAHLGVPPSGALDVPALRTANRLVGNRDEAACLELVLGGLRLRAECSCTVAVTGPAADVRVDGHTVGSHVPVHLATGAVLTVPMPTSGLRNYVAISGGIAARHELGSAATDLLSGIGPARLKDGDVVPLGRPVGLAAGVDLLAPARVADALTLPVLLGPRDAWFGDDAARQLTGGQWHVSQHSDRVGVRLEGPALRRTTTYEGAELPSEPLLTGAVQVPSGGSPVVFLADHPTTGGYPVIAVVTGEALPWLAQARPGSTIGFRIVG